MNQIKVGAVISYIALFFNILIGLLFTPWIIECIGKEDYGLYTLAMSVISFFVFDFGLGTAISRYVSKYLAEGKQDKIDDLLGLVFKLYLIGDIIVLIGLTIIYFLLPHIYQGLTLEELGSFKIVYIISALFCIISFPFIPLNGIIASYEKFIQLKLCDLIHKLIIVLLLAGCLLMGGGLLSVVLVNSIAGLIVVLMKLMVLGKVRPLSINWKYWEWSFFKSVFSFSLWVTIIQIAQRCIFNIAPSILAAFATSTEISILGIAICIEGYAFCFANALNGMFLPRVSRMVANKNQILDLMIRVGRIQIFILGLICIGFTCLGKDFIHVWLGTEYEEVYLCALLIILPSFFHLPQEIGNTTIIAEGKVKLQAYAFMLMAIINLLFALPLTHYWGVKGLCSSIMIAYFARTLMMDIILYKALHINVFKFFKDSYLKIVPSLIIALLFCLGFNHLCVLSGWIGVILKAFVSFFIYVVSIWSLAMNQDERKLVRELIRIYK